MITKLADKWRTRKKGAGWEGIKPSSDKNTCADELEAALPTWTRIDSSEEIPKNECVFMWSWKTKDGQWTSSVGISAGRFYLQNESIDGLYYRPLCDLDYPEQES